MSPPELRKKISLGLAFCGAIIILSYGYAGFLLHKRRQAPKLPHSASSTASPPKTDKLLATASAYLKRDQVEQALVAYREALWLNPHLLAAQMGLAEGELRAGRERVAADEFQRALKLDGSNRTALLRLAEICAHNRATWPEAEANYQKYLALNPSDAHATLALARILTWEGKTAEPSRLYARSDVQRLMTPTDERNYAFGLVKLGRSSQAEPMLKHLIAANPNDLELKMQLAGIYAARKDWNSALPIYRSLLARRPDDPSINLNYGFELLATNNYRQALGPLRLASRAMPENPQAGLGYARALRGVGEMKQAAKQYQRIVPHFSTNPEVLRECADTLVQRKAYKKATKYYAMAYGRGLHDERLLVGYAGALTGCGRYKAALPYWQEAYRREPTNWLAFQLANVLYHMGRDREALDFLRRVHPSGQRAASRG